MCTCQGHVSQPLRADSRKERDGQRSFSRPWVSRPDRCPSVCVFTCSLGIWGSFPFIYSRCLFPRGCLPHLVIGEMNPPRAGINLPPDESASAVLLCLRFICVSVSFIPQTFDVIKSITLSFVSYHLCLSTHNFPRDSELILCIFS